MGIGVQELQFLVSASKKRKFGKTLTIGRQGVHIFPHQGNHFLKVDNYVKTEFCEEMFTTYFGSTEVDSLDASKYEGATIIHDLNKPWDGDKHKYDTIFDGGSLEHVYNVPEAFKTISKLCKVGGTIMHSLPLNNNCGHGFYQFSPQLFFSLYSEKNGYSNTSVLVGSTENPNDTYKIKPPTSDKRLDIQVFLYNRNLLRPMYALVTTTLERESFTHDSVQQNDYEHIWETFENDNA